MRRLADEKVDSDPSLHHLQGSWLLRRLNWRRSAKFVAGNHATLQPHGGDFFPALLAAMAQARERITLEYYIIRSDSLGHRFAEAMTDAVRRGVDVYLVYDYVGSFDTPAGYFQRLEQSGVKVVCFNRPKFGRVFGRVDKRDHRKLAIIDGEQAFLGGLNIGDEYSGYGESPERWRDFGVTLTGPVIHELQRLFWETWKGEGGVVPEGALPGHLPEATGVDRVLVVSGGPNRRRSMIKRAYQLAIAHSAKSLVIVTPYFLPGPRLVRAMLKAVKRGVHVVLLLPGESDVPLLKVVSHPYLNLLLKMGVVIFEMKGTVLHAKLMLVDDLWAMIGSANFDQRSFYRNFETNLIIESGEFSRKVAGMLEEDLARSVRVNYDAHRQRTWCEVLLEWLFSPLKRFL